MASQALSTPPQAVSSVATPKKPSPSPVPDSPGNWNHPRLAEIRRRQKKTSFTEANVNQILYNAAVILGTYILHSYMGSYVPIKYAHMLHPTEPNADNRKAQVHRKPPCHPDLSPSMGCQRVQHCHCSPAALEIQR